MLVPQSHTPLVDREQTLERETERREVRGEDGKGVRGKIRR